MNIIRTLTPATLALSMALIPSLAGAQARPRGNGAPAGTAVERGVRGGGGQARAESRSSYGGGAMARGSAGGGAAVRGVAPRGEYRAAPRAEYRAAPRAEYRAAPRAEYRGVPRGQYYAPRPPARYGYVAPRYYGSPYYRPHFDHPYYTFRPHTHIGFGLWIGYGVPYPYAYVASYPPPVYGYYGGRFCVVPGARVYGGISFDIAPAYAPVYVDGTYIGIASDFGPYGQPLTLVPGPHRVMVSVGGYRPISWNVTIAAGQVIPFHGTMAAY